MFRSLFGTLVVAAYTLTATVTGFVVPSQPPASELRASPRWATASSSERDEDTTRQNEPNAMEGTSSVRRKFFQTAMLTTMTLATGAHAESTTPKTPKILVLGATGFVGSRVVTELQTRGIACVPVTRRELEILSSSGNTIASRVQELATDCTAVISCWGAIGTTPEVETINAAAAEAAVGAKAAGCRHFVALGVAPEVVQAAGGLAPLQYYLRGKAAAQEAVLAQFGGTVVEPTFIYGGDEFQLNPPRVAGFYGAFIEGLLSSGPIRSVERVLPRGNIVQIALEPPVSGETVAKAAVAAALGQTTGATLSTYDQIKAAAALLD